MPLLQMLATVQEEQSLGHLQQLTSPVLGKLKEALIFTRLANAQRRAFGSRTVVLDGIYNAQLHLGWFEEARLLVMAYKNTDCNAFDDTVGVTKQHAIPHASMQSPSWLRAVAPDAEVHEKVLEIFESFKDRDQCLAQVIQSVTGGVTPRRITSVGYCVGGAIASLAAVFAALQCPTADVRCITFGSQIVGNAAFAEAFRWLVGLSYRVVYRRDPIPAHKHRRLIPLSSSFVQVHGEIYIDDEQLTPGKQPFGNHFAGDIEDHGFMRYAEAMHAICLAHFERDQATGGQLYAKFARCYLQLAGMQPSQANSKPHHLQEDCLALPNQVPAQSSNPSADAASDSKGEVNPMTGNRLPSEGPFDFRSPVQDGRPEGPSPTQVGQPAPGSAQDHERGMRCGKALLERAMLGPPVPDAVTDGRGETDGPAGTARHGGTGAVGVDSTMSAEEAAAHSSRFFDSAPDANQSALFSVIRDDIETDGNTEASPDSAAAAAAAVAAAAYENMGQNTDTSERHSSSQQGPNTAAESISPRYSSQQSQGTNIDWHSDTPEVSSHPVDSLHAECASSSPKGTSSDPQDESTSAQNSTTDPQQEAGIPSSRLSMSKSGQQANALTEDVQGMAPNPACSMVGEEGGGRPWLKRAFSMVHQENMGIDMNMQMDSLDKVLITGKISQAVVVAAAAYRSESEFRERTGIKNTKLIIDEFHTNTHVHVGWLEGGTAILAFRGTQTAQDGLQDVKIVRQSIDHLQGMFPGTQAHSGFLQQFAGVCRPDEPEKNMATVLEQLSGGRVPTRVLCCGHSLGGALATLGATWAALEYPQADIRCITFGSPRVGNKAFKKAFHTLVGTSLRLVHGGDPVPVLPPAFVYHHVNGAIHIKGGKIKLRSRPWHFKLRPNVADHLVARYNAGIFLHMPGGVEEMPLPRPRNMHRLSSLQSSLNDRSSRGSAGDRISADRSLSKDSPTGAEEDVPQVGGSSAYGVYGSVVGKTSELQNHAVQEARDVADVLHLGKRPKHQQRSEGLFGSFRKLKRDSAGSSSSGSGSWTMWHMFGCVAMHNGVKDESSSSDEDESVHPVHTRHSARSCTQ